MTMPHDPHPDAADADDELPMPLTLAPMLTVDPTILHVAYQYYLLDVEPGSKAAAHALHAFQALSTVAWAITDAGALELTGSDGTTIYVVDTSCCVQKGIYTVRKRTGKHSATLCKGWQYTGGACYHRIAFELLRIVQAMHLDDA